MNATTAHVTATPGLVLEPDAQALADKLYRAGAPPLYTLSPQEARAVLEQAQWGDIALPPAIVEPHTIPGGPDGEISITVVRPWDRNGSLPAVVYTHGGGWILGSFATHERLVRDLAAQSGAAMVFVNYTPSPEARYPVALEQVYATIEWVARYGRDLGLDGRRLAIAGDSVGGNMTAAAALLAKARGGPAMRAQVLLYPVTDAGMETASYREFADGPWLTKRAMRWFWDAYAPDADTRSLPTVSPLQAPLEQLAGLPPTLLITDEADVLRDEGEAYGRRLRQAGVSVTAVRYEGVFHDFMMLNALSRTNATRSATRLAAQVLHGALSAR